MPTTTESGPVPIRSRRRCKSWTRHKNSHAKWTGRRGLDNANSNRTNTLTYPDDNSQPTTGHCTTSTTSTNVSGSYNGYDQLTSNGYGYTYVYDAFGRTTTVPQADPFVGVAMTFGYYVNDMAASQTQSGRTRSWTLDPAERVRTDADTSGSPTTTSHYDGGSDSPSWTSSSDGTWKRYIAGIDGNLALIQTSAGTPQLQLNNLHGDVVSTADDTTTAAGVNSYLEETEFGTPRSASTAKYGWLGGKQRSSDALGGVVLMGVRLYNPTIGRFLQTDPIPGGSANAYDYANQDPVNEADLSGQCPVCVLELGDLAFVGGASVLAYAGLTSYHPHVYVPHFSNPFGGSGADDYWNHAISVAYAQATAAAYASFRAGERAAYGTMYSHGKGNVKHSHHVGVSDEELLERYRDPSTPKAEKQKIKATLKGRGVRGSRQNKD